MGWVPYRVQPNDTLYSIALATSSSVAELRSGNCLEGAETPSAGNMIFLPRQPLGLIPLQTPAPLDPSTPLLRQGCTVPGAQISEPAAGETLDGVFTLNGTASISSFQYYRVEIRPDSASLFNLYERGDQPVVDGALAEINTALYGDGLHWIRLTVVQRNGNFPTPCVIPVIFR